MTGSARALTSFIDELRQPLRHAANGVRPMVCTIYRPLHSAAAGLPLTACCVSSRQKVWYGMVW